MFLGSCLSGNRTFTGIILGSGSFRGHCDEKTAGVLQQQGLGDGIRAGSSFSAPHPNCLEIKTNTQGVDRYTLEPK